MLKHAASLDNSGPGAICREDARDHQQFFLACYLVLRNLILCADRRMAHRCRRTAAREGMSFCGPSSKSSYKSASSPRCTCSVAYLVKTEQCAMGAPSPCGPSRYIRSWWSVTRVNSRPYRHWWKCLAPNTRANASCSS